ncbi:MAG: PD-(D/E)XK nuclease family protein, partial [Candidatus Omnitrophica bacterium]|nr:PD-(D/E)XK nuclease family protein [Candidatus Omnitrophota bacterium]
NNKARYMISENISEEGNKKKYERKKKDIQPVIEASALAHKGWLELVRDEFVDYQSIRNQEAILEGNILHLILSRIGDCSAVDKEEAIKKALETAQVQYPFIKDFSFYESKVLKLLAKEELRDVFFVTPSTVFCEKKIVNRFGESKRIDRLIVKKKEIWVVDYKSSRGDASEGKKQVTEYMQAIKDIYPKQKVRGFLIYLDEAIKEEVAG